MTHTIAQPRHPALRPARSLPASIARRMVLNGLERFTEGRLTIIEPAGRLDFGDPAAPPELHATIRIRDPRAYALIAFGASVGAGEAYMDALWDAHHDDVTRLIQLLLRNRAALESLDARLARLASPLRRLAYRFQANSRDGSRRNIAAHYDLSNDLFQTFLDPTMTYSGAIFEHGADTLEAASVEKLDRACRKLDLQPSDHLLEIGTGWGSLALHAATHYRCRVTTTTISREQAALARERLQRAGLTDRVTVLASDYRDLTGRYDKLISIEMIEAVGREFLDAFLAKCADLLMPDGLMLLQAITIRDQFDDRAARNRDWLKKHIFPGSCLLSTSALTASIKRATDLRIAHLEDIGPHYVTTLRHWRARFNERLDDVARLGFDDRFTRMWNYYFCYCEGAFLERHCGDVQLLAAKPRNRTAPYAETGPRVPLRAIAPQPQIHPAATPESVRQGDGA